MTKHALAKRLAHLTALADRPILFDPGLKARGAKRRRKAWLAKRHKKAIAIALAVKRNAGLGAAGRPG